MLDIYLNMGAEKKGYWTSEWFMEQIRNAAQTSLNSNMEPNTLYFVAI